MPEDKIEPNPIELFRSWYDKAMELASNEPASVVLATASKEGIPSARVVLLKGYDERGFRIFTNVTGRKGHELIENPHAALCFYWDTLDRQIRIEGDVERVSGHEADEYFGSRSRESRIGAWASSQSRPMEHPDDLKKRVAEFTKEFEGQEVLRPPFWDGFRVIPKRMEFWEKRDFRLHRRILYTRNAGKWEVSVLYP